MTQRDESLGPYLLVACLCENVIQRADQVLTLVNIIDRVTISSQSPNAPETMPATNWQAYLVVIIKAGRARGRYEMRIVPERPDGTSGGATTLSVNFEGEDDRGVQLVTRMVLALSQEGLHWFKIYLGGELLTKLPLRLLYSRVITSGPPGLTPGSPA